MAHQNRTAIFSDVRRQVKTNFNFGTSLLKTLILQTNSTSSIAVSPVYVLCALAQLNLGAKDLTAKEIARIFGRDKSAQEIANYYGTTNFLKEKPYSNSIYEAIKTACKANRYSLLREFRNLNQQYFGKGREASFMTYETQTSNDGITSNPSTSTDITSTASTFKTANVDFPYDIKNPVILSRPSFYLVTKWPCLTVIEEPFFTSKGNSTQIAQMHGIQKFGYFECNRVKVLRIDIDTQEGEVTLGVILPTERFGLDKLLRSINGKTVQKWFENAAKTTKVNVQLPKFTTVSNHSSLNRALISLGLESMFDATADFSGISGGRIWIENIVQEAKVRIDGKKIEGAAVTPGLLEPLFPMKSFIADHPFLYVVVDKQGNLLLVGVFRGNELGFKSQYQCEI